MSHARYLRELLRPLGVYDLSAPFNGSELDAQGAALDGVMDRAEEVQREVSLVTAETWGLENTARLFVRRPVASDPRKLASALAALLRIGGDSFTPEAINDTMQGCGLNVLVREGDRPGYVKVYFPNVAGIPGGFDRLRAIIEEILPSHVDITYVFWYNTWEEVAGRHPTWGEAADTGLSWYGLAIENEGLDWPD